jgi:hypothetical protein
VLSEPSPDTWRCWNGLSQDEFDALAKSGRPLESCQCRGCIYLRVRGVKDVPRSELTP